MEKLDVKKALSHLYKATAKKCVMVDVSAMNFLMIDGRGNLRGKHHEIYLGDPRKSAPEKLKTIIRQPIQKVSYE